MQPRKNLYERNCVTYQSGRDVSLKSLPSFSKKITKLNTIDYLDKPFN